jgi:hypothetical protein
MSVSVLFQLVADLIEPRVCTAIVEIGAGRDASLRRSPLLTSPIQPNFVVLETQ